MKKSFQVLAVVLAVAMLSALCAVFAVAEEPAGLIVDLGSAKPINGVKATLTSSHEKVVISGSLDGENYYELNAGNAVSVSDGAANLDFAQRGDVNARYILIQDADDASKAVSGSATVVDGSSDIAKNPEGPYAIEGINAQGYGICYFKAEDAPDGFGVNDAEIFKSNDKNVNLPMCQLVIAEEVEEGVYKILWNDVNGWPSKQHDNVPEGVEGVEYKNDKVYLADNQIVLAIMSAGAYATGGDGENSTAKWIIRGLRTYGFLKISGSELTLLPKYDAQGSGDAGEERTILWLKCDEIGSGSAPSINFKIPGEKIAEGEITVEAVVFYSEDCENDDGCVYTNCYSYGNENMSWDGENGLITYADFSKDSTVQKGEWVHAQYTFDPSQGTYGACEGKTVKPVCLSMGIGYWKAKGTIKVAELNMYQNGETLFHLDFENGFDPAGKDVASQYNMTDATKDVSWGLDKEIIKAEEAVNPNPPVEKLPFWVTHIDPETHLEGTGEIYTETDPTGAWCYHLAFEPVKGKKTVFKLVEKTSNGEDAAALEVPEGGFVYAINQGNNWPALMADKKGDGASGAWYDDETHLNMPNYNTENVLATWAIIPGLEVGEVYTFENLDLEGKTIPTSTPDKDYWDPEYVCTCFIMKGDLEEENPNAYKEEIEGKVGDPNPDSAFTTELVSELDDDGNVTVTLTIKGMKAEDKIIGFQIPVYFDAERLEPDLSDIKDEALNCVAEDGMPGSNWENLTAAKVVEKDGESYIYFQCGTAKTDYCDENTELVATFHFTMKEGFEEAGVWTTNANTKCFIDDGLMTTVLGAGSFTVAEEEEVIEPTPTPTPTPTPSETPGDAGIIVFAILGVLAVIGAAVVIKVRK